VSEFPDISATRSPGLFSFDPPLTLEGGIVVHTLKDAAAFARSYPTPRLPKSRDNMLRWIERATNEDQQRRTADLFRTWADSEGVLIKTDQPLGSQEGGL
jgi:hypothetical protein